MLTFKRLNCRDGVGLECICCKLFSTGINNLCSGMIMKENRKFCSDRMMLEFMRADVSEDGELKRALAVDLPGDFAGGREEA